MMASPPRLVAAPTATQNACKMCAPLGANLAFRGIEGTVPLIHGSQGCATYIRRHLIGHFREPVDIASSSFTEQTAIFGGQDNLFRAFDNVTRQYGPRMIGVATSCLSETLGEDVKAMVYRYRDAHPGAPLIVMASTPSYRGTHSNGFHAATWAVVDALAGRTQSTPDLALFPGFVSCADLRHLKRIVSDFGLSCVTIPDYSETLDAPASPAYAPVPMGGTPIDSIRGLGNAAFALTLGMETAVQTSAGRLLQERFGVPHAEIRLPIGVDATDAFFGLLSERSGRPVPDMHRQVRGRLIDTYVDAHKYLFGVRIALYGEEALVAGLAHFLAETGACPVLCATGGRFRAEEGGAVRLDGACYLENADFARIEERIRELEPELLIGDSHGYAMSRELNIPLVRVGFPIHDRIGAQRTLHVGYEGTQQLLDRVVNAILRARQERSPVGYQHM